MNLGKTLNFQLMGFLPLKNFHRVADRNDGDRYAKSMTCAEQFRLMVFVSTGYGCHFLPVFFVRMLDLFGRLRAVVLSVL